MAAPPASPAAPAPARPHLRPRWTIALALLLLAIVSPLLPVLGCALLAWCEQFLPAGVVSGAWGPPTGLALGAAASWWLFTSVVPGLLGWLLGLGLLALVKTKLPELAGLHDLLIIQAPLTITLAEAYAARRRRCQQDEPRLTAARALLAGLTAFWLLLALISPFSSFSANSAEEGRKLLVAFVLACAALCAGWWLSARLVRALLPRPGRLSADGHTVLNSVFGYGTFVSCCLTLPLLLPVAGLCALAGRGARLRLLAAAMRRGMRLVLFCAPTVAWRYDGELAALERARVVVANHEGMLDILAVCSLPGTRTLLAKTWVFRAFPLGLAARAAGLRNSDELEAEDYQASAEATSAADHDAGILVFPEGRRSRGGVVERFRPGAFVLSGALGAAVVPVAISGSRQGIRPDGMWIHPTILHCRVLPPMTRADDETHRQFAERCRLAISAVRLAVLCEQLGQPRMVRNRLQHYTGLGWASARAVRAEHRTGAWRVLSGAVRDEPAPWLFLGCGWSTLAVSLRQLLPGAAIIACEPAPERRAAASCAWFAPETDQLCAHASAVVLPPRLSGLVCLLPLGEVALDELALRALALLDGVLLAPPGVATALAARHARHPADQAATPAPASASQAAQLVALRWPGG